MGIEKIAGKVVSAAQEGVKKAPQVAKKAQSVVSEGKEKLTRSLDALAAVAKAKLKKPAPEGVVDFVNTTVKDTSIAFDKMYSEIPQDKIKEGVIDFAHQGLEKATKKAVLDDSQITKGFISKGFDKTASSKFINTIKKPK